MGVSSQPPHWFNGNITYLNSQIITHIFNAELIQQICVNVSQSTLAKQDARLAMPVGSCIALSMGSSRMDRCQAIKPLVEVTIRSILFSLKPVLVNMYPALYSLISSPLLLTR